MPLLLLWGEVDGAVPDARAMPDDAGGATVAGHRATDALFGRRASCPYVFGFARTVTRCPIKL